MSFAGGVGWEGGKRTRDWGGGWGWGREPGGGGGGGGGGVGGRGEIADAGGWGGREEIADAGKRSPRGRKAWERLTVDGDGDGEAPTCSKWVGFSRLFFPS